jgi:multiple sugar transport system permease protein
MKNAKHTQYLYTILSIIMLAVFLFPIYWMISTSVKPDSEILIYPPRFVPSVFDFSTYQERLFNNPIILRYLMNSAIVGLGTTVLTLFLAAPAAHALAHFKIRGKSILIMLSLTSLMFPAIMLALPLFVVFSQLGLTDSYLGLILANSALALPFALVVLRPAFLNIPTELAEAAMIDGCTKWAAFFRIIIPLTKPALVTAAIFTFLAGWNDLVFALSLTNRDNFRPITAGLWVFVGNNVTDWNGVMALSTLAMLPPLAIFIFAQQYIISGLTSGSVK